MSSSSWSYHASRGGNGAAGAFAATGTSAGAGATAGAIGLSAVSCSGASCSVTLAGEGSRVRVLGSTLTFEHVRGGRAGVRVGDESVSFSEGVTVSRDGLRLTCTRVTSASVHLIVRSA